MLDKVIAAILSQLKLELDNFLQLPSDHFPDPYEYFSISILAPDNLPVKPNFDKFEEFCCYTHQPNHKHMRLGLGTMIKISSQGRERFKNIKKHYDDLSRKWLHTKKTPAYPQAFLSYAFDENDTITSNLKH